MDVGRRVHGALTPLDFEILYFPINFSAEKFSCQFRVGKMKFHRRWPPWK